MINQRIFLANVGDISTGQAGPDAIEQDIDNLLANDQELLGTLNDHGTQINTLEANKADKTELLNYEEGTFTPTYECTTGAFTTLTYSFRAGRYTRIGRVVYFDINIATSNVTLGTAEGNLVIGGLPFSQGSANGAGAFATFLRRFAFLADDNIKFGVISNKINIYLDKPNSITEPQATPAKLKTGASAYQNELKLSGFYTL